MGLLGEEGRRLNVNGKKMQQRLNKKKTRAVIWIIKNYTYFSLSLSNFEVLRLYIPIGVGTISRRN